MLNTSMMMELAVARFQIRRTEGGGGLNWLTVSRVHIELFIFMKPEGVFELCRDEQDAIDSFLPRSGSAHLRNSRVRSSLLEPVLFPAAKKP